MRSNSSLIRSPHDQRAVFAAKGDAVADREVDGFGSRLVWDVVEIALGIGVVEIDGGVKEAGAHAEDGGGEAGGAAGALGVADHGFGGAHGDLICARAEALFQSRGLHLVVELGAGAVEIDVADFILGQSRLAQGELDGADGFLDFRGDLDAVIGIAAGAVAEDLGEDWGAALHGVLVIFQDEHPCPFTKHEAIAVDAEGPG